MSPAPLAREPLDQLSTGLQWAVAAAAVLATVALLVPGRAGLDIASAAVAVIVAAPLLRVAWLVVAWWRTGDRRFVVVGLVLLMIVAAGAVVAAIA